MNMKCCDNPEIELLCDPASDGKSYEVCANCGNTVLVEEPNMQAVCDAIAKLNKLLVAMEQKQAEIAELEAKIAFGNAPSHKE